MFLYLASLLLYRHQPNGFRHSQVCIAAMSLGIPVTFRQNLQTLLNYLESSDFIDFDLVFANIGTYEQEEVNTNISLSFPFDKRFFLTVDPEEGFNYAVRKAFEHLALACNQDSYTFFFGDYKLKDNLPPNILTKAVNKLQSAPDANCLYLRDFKNETTFIPLSSEHYYRINIQEEYYPFECVLYTNSFLKNLKFDLNSTIKTNKNCLIYNFNQKCSDPSCSGIFE